MRHKNELFWNIGQIAIAVMKANRHYVGYEIDCEYVKLVDIMESG